MPTSAPAPPDEPTSRQRYERRLDARREDVARWLRIDGRIGDARLGLFALALSFAAAATILHIVSLWWVLPWTVAFLILVFSHEPARRRLDRAQRAAALYERGIARLDDRWAGTGTPGLRFLDDDHPYAADLDLFGEGSLFERLCQARTRSGEAVLAGWLTAGAPPDTIRARQAAVAELRPCLDLRERIELLGTRERAAIDPDVLAAWGRAPRVFHGAGVRIGAAILGGANIAAVYAWAATALGLYPLLITIFATALFSRWLKRRVSLALAGLERSTRDLRVLAGLLDAIERARFDAQLLRDVQTRLSTRGRPASERIARLARLLHLLDTGQNQFFAPVAALLVWRPWLATAVDAWRAEHGPAIRDWLDATGTFEALCSVACYAAENPGDAVPEIVEGEARFEAVDLGHPLLPEAEFVRNDVRLGNPARVLVVSGSNMSGKSTLLRTVGVNTVLALAG
ncbi:MAG: DNA mismatch repair protein MutS, partial [Gemmatimonadota bacterium]